MCFVFFVASRPKSQKRHFFLLHYFSLLFLPGFLRAKKIFLTCSFFNLFLHLMWTIAWRQASAYKLQWMFKTIAYRKSGEEFLEIALPSCSLSILSSPALASHVPLLTSPYLLVFLPFIQKTKCACLLAKYFFDLFGPQYFLNLFDFIFEKEPFSRTQIFFNLYLF